MKLETENEKHMHYIMPHERMKYAELFSDNTRMYDVVESVLEGYFGAMLIDTPVNPNVGRLQCSVFNYFGGDPDHHNAIKLIPQLPGTHIMVFPKESRWPNLIYNWYEKNPPEGGRLSINQSFDFSSESLNKEHLSLLAELPLPDGLELKWVDMTMAKIMETQKTPEDDFACLPSTYSSAEDFVSRSFGFCVKAAERIVSRCVAFTVSSRSVNVDIETHPDFQHGGLATVVSARMLLYCLKNTINPAWNAVNTTSVKLAEKLGYTCVDYYETLMLAKGVGDPSWDIPHESSIPLSKFSFEIPPP